MNRRDALKKLGAGGAIVVGATAVRSVPAFAVGVPVFTPFLPTVNPATGGSRNVSVSFTVEIECPASSSECIDLGCVPPFDNFSYTTFLNVAGGTYTVLGDIILGDTLTMSLRRGVAPGTNPAVGDIFQIEYTVEATCTAEGQPAATDTKVYLYDFEFKTVSGIDQWVVTSL
jgi:hypothetical protein